MSDLPTVPTHASSFALAPDVPFVPISPRLQRVLDNVTTPHPDVGPQRRFPADLQREAVAALATIGAARHPVPGQMLRVWIAPITGGVRNPRPVEEMASWFAVVKLAIGELEAGAFNLATQQHALRTIKFFPAAADIAEIVEPVATALRVKVDALLSVVEGETLPDNLVDLRDAEHQPRRAAPRPEPWML